MKNGIDVSRWQGSIDWNKVKSVGVQFAIIKMANIYQNDSNSIDGQFERNYSECKRLGIPVGVYVYNYAKTTDRVQAGARFIVEKLQGKSLDLPVYIDMEDKLIQGLGKDRLTNICIEFNTIIEQSGRWAGVYANLNWFNNYLNKDEIKKRYTTWIAHYGVDQNKYNGQYDMLQYSSSEAVNGISGNVDMNIMYIDLISEINGSSQNSNNNSNKKSNEEIANEVINGLWGNGEDRLNRLTQAGYDYNAIQSIVNSKLVNNNIITYKVQKGDNLYNIAKKYNTTWIKIYNDNRQAIGDNPSLIHEGLILKIRK